MVLASLASALQSAVCVTQSGGDGDDVDGAIRAACGALLRSDVDVATVHAIREGVRASKASSRAAVRAALQRELTAALGGEERARGRPWMPARRRAAGGPGPAGRRTAAAAVVAVVGLQGAGKTTSASKLVALYRRRGLRVAAVAADTYRAGAVDQLEQNCSRIGGVPVFCDRASASAAGVLRAALERADAEDRFDVVVVDTAGRHAQDAELAAELAALVAVRRPDACYLVVDATQGGSVVAAHAAALRRGCPLSGVIVSKLDSASAGGGALTAAVAAGVPVRFVGTGERLGDLQEFDAAAFVRRLLNEPDLRAFDRWASEVEGRSGSNKKDRKKNTTTKAKKKKGRPAVERITLRDVRGQYQAMLAPGVSVAQGLSCLASSSSSAQDEEGAARAQMRRFLVLTDSCTDEELDADVGGAWEASRLRRVARGCGLPVAAVADMLGRAARVGALAAQMEAASGRREFGAREQRALSARVQAASPGMLERIGGQAGLRALMRR